MYSRWRSSIAFLRYSAPKILKKNSPHPEQKQQWHRPGHSLQRLNESCAKSRKIILCTKNCSNEFRNCPFSKELNEFQESFIWQHGARVQGRDAEYFLIRSATPKLLLCRAICRAVAPVLSTESMAQPFFSRNSAMAESP